MSDHSLPSSLFHLFRQWHHCAQQLSCEDLIKILANGKGDLMPYARGLASLGVPYRKFVPPTRRGYELNATMSQYLLPIVQMVNVILCHTLEVSHLVYRIISLSLQ